MKQILQEFIVGFPVNPVNKVAKLLFIGFVAGVLLSSYGDGDIEKGLDNGFNWLIVITFWVLLSPLISTVRKIIVIKIFKLPEN